MLYSTPRGEIPISTGPCERCDNISSSCIKTTDVAICIKEFSTTHYAMQPMQIKQITFEVGKTYEISDDECDNTGQHALYIKNYHVNTWFILKYKYEISGMGFKISEDNPAFNEYFEIVEYPD